MLELYYNCFTDFCDLNKFEESEIVTYSLHLALAENELEDRIWAELKAELKRPRPKGCTDNFTADAFAILFVQRCCEKHKKHDKRESGLFKDEFRWTEMLCLCNKTYCCYDVTTDNHKSSSKGLNKRVLEHSGAGPLEKYRRVVDQKKYYVNKQNFSNKQSHWWYDQIRKRLFYFYRKRFVK